MKRGLLAIAAIAAAAIAWLTLTIAARVGSADSYPLLAVVWSVHYAALGILSGLQHETTLRKSQAGPGKGHSVLGATALLALPVLIAVVVAADMTTRDLGSDNTTQRLLVALLAVVSVGGGAAMVLVLGQLAADDRQRTQSGLLVVDSSARLVAVIVVVAAGPSLMTLWLAMAASAWAWLPWGWRRLEDLSALRTPLMAFSQRAVPLMVSAAGTSLLLAGMPLLVVLLAPPDAASPGLLAALVLLRSPVLVVMLAYRPNMIARFAQSDDALRLGRLVVLFGAVACIVGACAAAVGGPFLVRLVAGTGFHIGPSTAAALVVSAILVAVAVVLTMALAASGAASIASVGWIAGVGSTALTLALGPNSVATSAVACLVGPAVVLVWFVVFSNQSRPREKADSRSWRE